MTRSLCRWVGIRRTRFSFELARLVHTGESEHAYQAEYRRCSVREVGTPTGERAPVWREETREMYAGIQPAMPGRILDG